MRIRFRYQVVFALDRPIAEETPSYVWLVRGRPCFYHVEKVWWELDRDHFVVHHAIIPSPLLLGRWS